VDNVTTKSGAGWYFAQSFSSSRIQVSLFDGSTRMVRPSISVPTWNAVWTMDLGDTPGSDW
jgi:hypothetical protein